MESKKTSTYLYLVVLTLLGSVQSQQSFSYEPSVNAPGLQIDSSGRTFVSAGSRVYRLSSGLVEEETVSLFADVVDRGLALSADGARLVVCLTNLSCSVFNASDLSAGPLSTVEGAIASPQLGVALFTAGDTFYTGSVTGIMGNPTMLLQQYGEGFEKSSTSNPPAGTNSLVFDVNNFARQFYGGFVRGSFAYFVVSDYIPDLQNAPLRSIRLLRLCHLTGCGAGVSSCAVMSLYEASLACNLQGSNSNNLRVCGVSVVENFGGLAGPVLAVTRCEENFARNYVCLVDLNAVNVAMDRKYDSCLVTQSDANEETDVAWVRPDVRCDTLSLDQVTPGAEERCNIPSPLGVSFSTVVRVTTGFAVPTASVAVKVEEFSFVFLATSNNMVSGYNAGGSLASMPFYSQPVNSTVHQMSWQQGQDYITAVTTDTVFQIPIEECSSRSDCDSCTADPNPLCGWCVVENKCSRQTQCQNSTLNTTVRWTRDSANCVRVSVSPSQYVLDEDIPAQNLTVSVSSPGLPVALSGERFSCHLTDSEDRFPPIVVPAVETNRTKFTCDIANTVPGFPGVSAVMNVGFVSSLVNISFAVTSGALTIYRCSNGSSCTDCLRDDSPCGWCNLNKVCSGTHSPCRDNSTFLQLSGNLSSSDLCPLVDQPPSGDYTHPVRVNQTLTLSTRNLISPTDGFRYSCLVNGVELSAQYVNTTSLLCLVNQGQLTLSAGIGMASVVAMVVWTGNNVNHPIGSVQDGVSVTLYDCPDLADGCSSCVGTRLGSEFMCGWCQTVEASCQVTQECSPQTMFVTMGTQCPRPVISTISPTSGPVAGGTAVTVMGSDLGVTFSDIKNATVNLGGVPCAPVNINYTSGEQFVCETTDFGTPGDKNFFVSFGSRNTSGGGPAFRAVVPTVTSIVPSLGPVAGGSLVTVTGTDLGVGNQGDTMVTFERSGPNATNISCDILSIRAEKIVCRTRAGGVASSALVVVTIDAARVNSSTVTFEYRSNPNVTSVNPDMTIPSGGITLTFSGEGLDVVRVPVLMVGGSVGGPSVRVNCTVVDPSTIRCVTPMLEGPAGTALDYSLILDGATPTTSADLLITVQPDPTNFRLGNTREVVPGSSTIIQISGDNLDSVLTSEINVTVEGMECVKTSSTVVDVIFCTAPPNLPAGPATVRVIIGDNINVELDETITYTEPPTEIPLQIVIPAVAGGVLLILLLFLLIICCVVCRYKSKNKKSEQRWTNLMSQMELLEMEMADECKRAFTELQTDLADLVHITDQNLPYRDFRTFAMRFLFPQDGDSHPVLHALALPEKADKDQVATQLSSFQHLIMDKKFLLIFVRSMEAQGQKFTLNDRCIVASLLMVCFQDNLDYATEILHALMAELMRRSMTKNSHPKLLLRRTESVAEKMLANWLAFLLFPYLLENVGEKLFILFRAIKSQLEKGAVDIITGEAKNSLSEEKLLRHHREVKTVDSVVVAESGEEFPVRLLDCDSITQAKEKVLDVLYKNTPVSKRPQLIEIDLELISTGAAGIPLRDQDATNNKDGEWIKVNTLGHYKLDEMSQAHADNPRNPVPKFRISKRPERPVSGMSFDHLGTIIANMSIGDRTSLLLPAEMIRVFHLVKPEPEEPGEGTRQQKIVSEVFLTRLLSTKRILQPYVDDLFESIFAVPHGRPLPKAVKSLFDFLDQQAAELGIQDPEILHTWKTNSLPLRFWVNVIKNPDFLFDIHKSATVDSCLTVIAQAYIDACSTTEFKYTKDTPAARLLYVNDVKKYKNEVLQYYGTIQSLPKVTQTEMYQYLRETAQVCSDSVNQYAPEITSGKAADPAPMKGQLYFVTESALYELFKFAARFSEEITDGLNEEGLTIQAASFDQIRRNMKAATNT